MNNGKLYLIPSILGKRTQEHTLPSSILDAIQKTNIFIVENLRTARRYIRVVDKEKDINSIIFYSYGKHDNLDLEKTLLTHTLLGENVGLISEAGLPCIADPGSEVVEYAHNFQIDVIPLVGPSSILLALMSSGLNGQNFAFNGYLPIDKSRRKKSIKELEEKARKTKQTQIFMETPYRNNQLIESILATCNNNTRLCIASNITMESENIKTKTISEWKQNKINLHKNPTIFLIG